MCLFNKKAPQAPLHSEDYEKLSKQITDIGNKVILLAAEMRGFDSEMIEFKAKVHKIIKAKNPEDSSFTSESSGLPTPNAKGLNTFNPFA